MMLETIAIRTVGGKVLDFLKGIPWQFYVIGVLVAAFTFMVWRADTLSEQRDEARKATITEQVKHDVTRASLASLSARMAELVAEGELRKERLSEALAEVERETAPMLKQAEQLERGEIDISEVEGL